jgi:DNA polymerase III subunit delta'
MSKSESLLPLIPLLLNHHQKILSPRMRKWFELKSFPSALLLTGPIGIGKRNVSYYLAQWLLCHQNHNGFCEAPCQTCPSCLRALRGSWVDFIEIVADDDTGSLKIDSFRSLKETLGFGAFESFYKIILIPNAECMTPQAANSLLKTLEEPPAGWIFLLTSSDFSLLLPTLVSRCQMLRLSPFSSFELLEFLSESGLSPERQVLCAELAQGSWRKAIQLTQDDLWEKRAALFRFLEKPQAEVNPLMDWASQEPHDFEFLLDQLEHITSDLLESTFNLKQLNEKIKWKNSDGSKALLAHADRVLKNCKGSPSASRAFWLKRSEDLFRVRSQLRLPLNRKLLLQEVLLPWLKCTHD